MPARRFRIAGVVQGVGFRYAMCREALQLELDGWVRNRRDGTVEAVAAGDEHRLERLQRWCAHGPRGAVVQHVDAAVLSEAEQAVLEPPVERGFRQVETA